MLPLPFSTLLREGGVLISLPTQISSLQLLQRINAPLHKTVAGKTPENGVGVGGRVERDRERKDTTSAFWLPQGLQTLTEATPRSWRGTGRKASATVVQEQTGERERK